MQKPEYGLQQDVGQAIKKITATYLQRINMSEGDLQNYAELSQVNTLEGCFSHILFVIARLGRESNDPKKHYDLLNQLDWIYPYFIRGEKIRPSMWMSFCQEARHVAESIGGNTRGLETFHDILDTRVKLLQLKKNNYNGSSTCLLYTSDAAERLLTCRSRWSPYH